MKVKKILSMLCAVSALSLCGCSGDLYEEDNIAEEASSDSAQTTEIKSDEKNKTGITDIGVSVSLDQNGRLNIQRNTAASVPMGENGTWTIFVYLCGTDLESDGGFATFICSGYV